MFFLEKTFKAQIFIELVPMYAESVGGEIFQFRPRCVSKTGIVVKQFFCFASI